MSSTRKSLKKCKDDESATAQPHVQTCDAPLPCRCTWHAGVERADGSRRSVTAVSAPTEPAGPLPSVAGSTLGEPSGTRASRSRQLASDAGSIEPADGAPTAGRGSADEPSARATDVSARAHSEASGHCHAWTADVSSTAGTITSIPEEPTTVPEEPTTISDA